MWPKKEMIRMSENDNKSTESRNPNSEKLNKKIEIKIKAKTKFHEIIVEMNSELGDMPTDIDDVIGQLSKSKFFSEKNLSIIEVKEHQEKIPPPSQKSSNLENPVRLFATRLEIDPDDFEKLSLIAIKGDGIQILKTTKLGFNENALLLLALNEYVLNQTSTSYDDWKDMFESSNIKTKTPYHKIINNCIAAHYIDKKKYSDSRELVLTAKGFDTVKKSIKKILS